MRTLSDRNEGVILVVEDDPAVRNLVTCALDVHGYRSREASTATAALADLTCARDVNLVILDLGLPDRDGTEVIGAGAPGGRACDHRSVGAPGGCR